jgi:hypothetical protein
MATIDEVAQALAVACLDHPEFSLRVTSGKDASGMGKDIGEFYQAIYKAALEAHSKAVQASKA